MLERRVEAWTAVQSAGAALRTSPPRVWVAIGLVEGGETLAGQTPFATVYPLAWLLILGSLQLVVTLLLVAILLSRSPFDYRSIIRGVVRRFPAAVGASLVQWIALTLVGLAALVIVAIFVIRPPAPGTGPGTFELVSVSVLLELLVAITLLLAAPLFGRWLCVIPFIVERAEGPIASLGMSRAVTRGSTLRCAALWLCTALPTLVTLVVPAGLKLPWGFVSGVVSTALLAAFEVAVFRQLCPRLINAYPLSELGRLAFEGDATALAGQGYFVVSSIDEELTRKVTFGRVLSPQDAPVIRRRRIWR